METNVLSGPDEQTLNAWLLKAQFEIDEADRLSRSGEFILSRLIPAADELKQHYPDWLTDDTDDARFIRGVENLRRARDAATPIATNMLNATQAAERMGLIRPNGAPRDSFYKAIKEAGGVQIAAKWFIAADVLDAYLKGERK